MQLHKTNKNGFAFQECSHGGRDDRGARGHGGDRGGDLCGEY
jgi:hypothetical protein